MKFNPLTKELYTDRGEFLKTLNCPYKVYWDQLEATNSTLRKCSNCKHLIVDTEHVTDDELLEKVKQNPESCLKIDLNQHNIKLISNGILEQK